MTEAQGRTTSSRAPDYTLKWGAREDVVRPWASVNIT